jgi:hypothetical protein
VQGIGTIASDSWDPATMQREQLSNVDIGLLLEEVEAGQHQQ